MESHGKNSPKLAIAIIPARYASTRLPGKMLREVAGKPLIVRTMERAAAAETVSRAIVATDDERIAEAIRRVGGEAVMTSPDHVSGSDRIAEVARTLPEGSIIVNVQGDEPLISPETIDRAVRALADDRTVQIATTSEPIRSRRELLDFNVVKVVTGDDGRAVYFSRSPVPFPREAALRYGGDPGAAIDNESETLELFRKHTGLYVYRREYLLEFAAMKPTRLEQIEMLEQLRALENGAKIKVVEAFAPSIGVDTIEDLKRVEAIIRAPEITIREASRDDIPQIAAVHVESWQRSFRGLVPDSFLDKMSAERRTSAFAERFGQEPYTMLVAVHPDCGVVGFADFGESRLSSDHEAQIYSFYLLPEYQRLGVGKRLFKESTRQLSARGVRSFCLDAIEKSPYRSFYDKLGGTMIGSDSHMFEDEIFETIIYGWTLKE